MAHQPIVIFGATGKVGSKVMYNLIAQGHTVRAVARDTAKLLPFAQ